MTVSEQLHTSQTHKPGNDPACPVCNPTVARTTTTQVLKPGLVVEFSYKGDHHLGVVKSIRAGRTTVIFDKGRLQISGPERWFMPSAKTLRADEPPESLMYKWSVTKYHGHKALNGVTLKEEVAAFEASMKDLRDKRVV